MKKNRKFMNKVLTGMFIFLIIFVSVCLFILYKTGVESPTLITAVFAFCTVEGGLGAWIKVTKEKRSNKKEDIENDTDS